jgi:hypothetical protein
MVSPVEIGASPDRSAAFDPRLFLTKLAAGKTSHDFQSDEFVFIARGRGGCGVLQPHAIRYL